MKKFITINLMIFLMFLLLGFDCIVSHAQEKVVRLNYQSFFQETHWNVPKLNEWVNEIEKGTDGTVKITRYTTGILAPPAQVYDSLLRGIVDMAEICLAYSPGRFPFMEITNIPMGGKNAFVGGSLMNELYKKFKPKELDKVKVLYFHTNTPYRVMGKNKPILKLEDFKGLKVRSSGLTVKIVKLLGGVAVSMPQVETYDALSRGVVDADINSDIALRDFRHADVTKYSTAADAVSMFTTFVVAMNKGKWDSLTPKQQKVIEEATSKLKEWYLREWDKQEVSAIEWSKKEKGVQFFILPPEEERRWGDKVKTLAEDYVQNTKKLGLPGEEAIKFAKEYIKTHK